VLQVKDIGKTFEGARGTLEVLRNIRFTVDSGEVISIIGPSGCGKTTLLRIMHGLEPSTNGEISISGKRVQQPSPSSAMVFQQFNLFPWLSVARNITFGLEVAKLPAAQIKDRTERFVRLVGLEGFVGHYPHELSGGMQQRVGLARALASDPEVMLMDEPLGALDALTREQIQELILYMWQATRKMFFFITHSVEEALFLATELIVMTPSPGRIAHRYKLDFSRQFVECKDARKVKANPEFIALREEVLQLIHSALARDELDAA